ncbi:hypothetical protein Z517_06838 [Fonsecaea pedrosoi CBS 271.37]|uniref:Epoxide hydrolase N-terminal domain-containing protein n=1 Tax=Fonsecaea pedrosoi CBS 271.37 TaxID=1442368 RepID=A0A0D2GHE7_9EURO|nr:uncharacterized protein Z517_06838 [Fonsecaea pedrosoi CBS 271.37]KIW80223.1 hypothetical protein Z517_06838 [Fonsecaea pedrosoi CBS 271.37]
MAVFSNLPASAENSSIRPFTCSVGEQELDDSKSLIRLSKVAVPTFENTHTGEEHRYQYGIDREFILKAKDIWMREYDWRATEARINSYPNFMAEVIDDDRTVFQVHFLALFSTNKNAIPLLMLHGWPGIVPYTLNRFIGNVMEFFATLDLLKEKFTPESLPYHIVVPSLPGYAFSSLPEDKDFKVADSARIIHKLMLLLGLRGYVAQGGDIGSGVARYCLSLYDECKAAHVNLLMGTPPPQSEGLEVTEEEQKGLARIEEFMTLGSGYAISHATVPSTTGLTLAASPLGLLAWVGEKLVRWADEKPPIKTILDFVSLYFLTGTIERSIHVYREVFIPGKSIPGFPPSPAGKTFGFSDFAKESTPPPKSWAEYWAGGKDRLQFYRYHESGGHFAALEKPVVFLKDVMDFVAMVQERDRQNVTV